MEFKIKHIFSKSKAETKLEATEQSLVIMDGSTIYTVNEKGFVEGSEIYTKNAESTNVPLTEGVLNVTKEKTIEFKNGIITSVLDVKEEVPDEKADVTTEDKTAEQKMSETENQQPAYIELPVGEWTIGEYIYKVVEILVNEGKDDEMRMNVIDSKVKADGSSDVEEVATEEKPKEEAMSAADEEEKVVEAADETPEEEKVEDTNVLDALKAISEQIKTLTDSLSDTNKKVEELSNEPLVQSLSKEKEPVKKWEEMTSFERFMATRKF